MGLFHQSKNRSSARRCFKQLSWLSVVLVIQAPTAKGATHWAFVPPNRPALPKVRQESWIRNPIDRFVLANLEKQQLAPSPPADRATLIRRLALDLTGLPPAPAGVDEFLSDTEPGAYERVVERLLASPHYGERWARDWLDAARYADSNGFEKDLSRSIWPYRDWVIEAFNRDLPFDEFAIEQLAGDLLPNSTLDQRVATGFLRNSMLNEEGGVDPEQFRVESIVDRMDTIGKAFLGLTIQCAQCHDHKFDPISQREYYQMFAFLNNDDEPELEVPGEQQQTQRAAILASIAKIEEDARAKDKTWPARMAAWERKMRMIVRDWTVLDPETFYGAVGTKFNKLDDESLLATASNPPISGYTIQAKTDQTNITAFQLEVLIDPNLPAYGPGRAKNGNFVLTEFTVEAAPLAHPDQATPIALQNATADFSQDQFPVSAAIDGITTNHTGWAIDAGPGRDHVNRRAVFETKEPVGFAGGTVLTFHLEQIYGGEHTIGRLRLLATTGARPLRADPLPAPLREVLQLEPEQRTPEQRRSLFSLYRTFDPQFAEANESIEKLMNSWPAAPTTLVLSQRRIPRETHILKRGDFQKPLDLVQPGVPEVLNSLPPAAPLNRLTFARWLVDRKSPTTARAVINRVWQHYFGQGIVPTAENLGTQGEPPSNQALLDWLACEFMDSGWSLKHMHRLIVDSATYRQSSNVSPELYAHDPYNRLLARGPRFRVEGEVVRDIALAASGLLNEEVGGPPVYPPIPNGVLNLGYTVMKWETAEQAERYRRSMYTFWKRSVPYPALLVFGTPKAETACVRRVRSNTPLQALTTLNETLFFEAAQALGLSIARQAEVTDESKAALAFRRCLGRAPDATELGELLNLYRRQLEAFEHDTRRAIVVAARDPSHPPAHVNLHEAAAWTMVARVILNLDETITKD